MSFFKKDISMFDLLFIVAKNIRSIILFQLIALILAILYYHFILDLKYVSSAKIMSSEGSKGNLSGAAGLAAQFGFNLGVSQSDNQWVLREIVNSRTLAKSVLKHKFDTKAYGEQKTLFQILSKKHKVFNESSEYIERNLISIFSTMLDFSEDIKTSIYTIKVKSFEPKLSSDINNVIINELDLHQKKHNKLKNSEARKFIEERIKTTEMELESAEEKLKDFTDRNRRIENSPSLKLDQQRLNREVAVLIGVFTTLKQQLEKIKIEEVKDSDYVLMLDPPEVPIDSINLSLLSIISIFFFIGTMFSITFFITKDLVLITNQDDKNKVKKALTLMKKNTKTIFKK